MIATDRHGQDSPAGDDNNPASGLDRHGSDGLENYDSPAVEWSVLIGQIRLSDTAALGHLYHLFSRGIRFQICRQLGTQDLDDRVHDTFLVIVEAIQKGDLRDPERLMGFVRTIVRRQVASYINANVSKRRDEVDIENGIRLTDLRRNPEQRLITQQQQELVQHALERLTLRDREILTRFYLHEQTQEQICDEMDLSETQFRLLKSRAKARFGEIGKKKLQQQALSSFFVRTSTAGSH
jgi:RNA polymerase sigma-70 factor, ECF subfamily